MGAAGTNPIYSATPNIGKSTWTSSSTGIAKDDGTATAIGTDMNLLYSAGANGSFIQKVRFSVSGSTASTASTGTVVRLYISTQSSGATTNVNTVRWDELACPTQTVDSPSAGTNVLEIQCGFAIPPSTYILWNMNNSAAANTVWQAICIANDY